MVRVTLLFVLAAILSFCSVACAQPRVLVIESYHSDYEWDKSYIAGLRSTLKDQAEILTFQLNTKRIPPSEFAAQAQKAYEFYKKTAPDFVVLGDDNAAALLGRKISSRKSTIIYLGVSGNPREYGLYGIPNVYGVIEIPLIKRSLLTLSQLFPSFTKFLILFDESTTSRKVLQGLLNNQQRFSFRNIQAEIALVSKAEEWQKQVEESKQNGFNAIVIGTYHTLLGADKTHIHEDDVISWTNANSPLPLFGIWNFSIGKGKTAGGLLLAGEDQGREAARIILEVMRKHNVAPLPVTPLPRLVLSKYEMKRWNLSLPDNGTGKIYWVE